MSNDEDILNPVFCGYRTNHLRHHFFTDLGVEEWCDGYSQSFRSNPDDAWDEDDESYYGI